MRFLPLLLFIWLLEVTSFATHAQLRDDFADGDFGQTPAWTGDAASFQVNAARQLQSAGPAATGTQLQLATPCRASAGTTWEFWANLKLATSSGNYADVYLLASQADLKASGTSGYFVRLGGTNDEISLFRRDSTRGAVVLIDGQNQTLSSTTNNLVRVQVTRTADHRWRLARDLSGGRSFTAEIPTPLDATYQRSQAVGVLLTYSSANSRNFYFDDFLVTDATAPQLLRATPVSSRVVDLVFNEALDPGSAFQVANYRLAGSGAAPLTAQVSARNPAVVQLTFGADFGPQNVVEARQVADLFGNAATGPLTAGFVGPAGAPGVGELIISEIFADETPGVGLPPSEFVELHNRNATKVLSLRGVRLLKPGSTPAAAFADTARLLPGQYAVVCGSTRAAQFAALGVKVYGLTNFPGLGNEADQLVLRGANGQTLFEVSYADTWYGDPRRRAGGYSLELRDPNNYCAGADNWTASPDPRGGTPGRPNAAAASNPDRLPPTLLRAVPLNALTVRLFFSEKLDSAAAANPAHYRFSAELAAAPTVLGAAPVPYDFRAVDLTLAAPLRPSQPVRLSVQQATDCAGNAAGPLQTATFALPEPAAPGDLVINEILFNARVGGVDFVEVLNRSAKYIDLQGYQVASEKPDKSLAMAPVSAAGPYVLAPGQFVAFTEKPEIIQAQYPSSHEAAALLAVPGFPTLPDDAGTVLLLDARGPELDRYAYNKNQQLSLLSSLEGVSLERIRAQGPSRAENFHSAAASVGYATPGRPNSQAQDAPGGNQALTLSPEIFTPDDDGQQDFTTLSYQLDQPGYVASITVYDALGRPVRRLLRNQTLATTGLVPWDGVDDHGHKAAVGYYVLVIELFRPSGGERREYKKTVVVGARL
ncbi:lamin tail domain-containing protein [uncultured Hymenobacter sp.]|uniref:lamin tail domain-containing protein n=1 Tax=uncultured Hymenobacter sp. TaxID=170016 RepID=UPI0035CC348F